jgi:hypothetical protein
MMNPLLSLKKLKVLDTGGPDAIAAWERDRQVESVLMSSI